MIDIFQTIIIIKSLPIEALLLMLILWYVSILMLRIVSSWAGDVEIDNVKPINTHKGN